MRPDPRNALLRRLSPEDLEALSRHLEFVDLPRSMDLFRPDEPIRSVFFPESGIASVVTPLRCGRIVEVGVIGREGMVGVPVVLGAETTSAWCFMQAPGAGWSLGAGVLRAAFDRSPALRTTLLRHAMASLAQVAQTGACNAVHTVRERLARWLLATHDRCDGDRIALTQEGIASMLAVRRAGVTEALGDLREAGIVTWRKGQIVVLDRAALEGASCECHGLVRDQAERLFP